MVKILFLKKEIRTSYLVSANSKHVMRGSFVSFPVSLFASYAHLERHMLLWILSCDTNYSFIVMRCCYI